jgi:hypothetical protein
MIKGGASQMRWDVSIAFAGLLGAVGVVLL